MHSYTIVSPGRVNLIGEHVDHQNYPVFPCAIRQAIELEVEQYCSSDEPSFSKTPALQIFHKSGAFPSVIFQEVSDIKVVKGEHNWYNYLIASYFGIVEYIHYGRSLKNGHSIDRYQGLPKEMVHGTNGEKSTIDPISPVLRKYKLTVGGEGVPQAAGLSSSSALTCAGSFAWLVAPSAEAIAENREGNFAGEGEKCVLSLTRSEIAHVSAHGEGYSGTASGGMDQAAICLSQAGKALKISFNPLGSVAYDLPKELAIVVGNTGRAAPKAVSAAKMYNKRVFELKAACYLILKKHNITLSPIELIVTGLRDVLRMIKMDEQTFLDTELLTCMKEAAYTREDIDACVDPAVKQFLLEKRCGEDVWTKNDDFHLFERVRHVITEQARVERFSELCKKYGPASATESTPESVLLELGELLNGSFESLSGDFDAGCAELDELVNICRKAGAYGSRLTGAGWGGCTVSLVHKDKVPAFLKEVETKYFKPIITKERIITPPLEFMVDDMSKIGTVLFATEPSKPARVQNYQ